MGIKNIRDNWPKIDGEGRAALEVLAALMAAAMGQGYVTEKKVNDVTHRATWTSDKHGVVTYVVMSIPDTGVDHAD